MDTMLMSVAGVAAIAFLVVSIIAAVVAKHRRRDAVERCHFRPKKTLMTGKQRTCFQLLHEIFGQKFYIIPEVSLSSLLSYRSRNRYEAEVYIKDKTVDFVFCNKKTLRPVCAIKLEDGSNANPSQQDLDEMTSFFRSAHLPFVRINKPQKLTRDIIIEEFSRVIYETSILPTPKKSS